MLKTICALFILCWTSWSTAAESAKPLTTMLLVARADLPDPNFKDSIVLVMNHLGPVPAGFIVNRPTRVLVSELFPDIERLAGRDDKVYFGGPVEVDSVSFMFRAAKPPENATEVLAGVYFSTNVKLLRDLLRRDSPMEGLRIFAGYSGWSPGQLENEIARGDWTLAPADSTTIFDHKSEHPWPEQAPPGSLRRT